MVFSIDELRKYQALPYCLDKPTGGMPELIDKDNAESQLLQAPPGKIGGVVGFLGLCSVDPGSILGEELLSGISRSPWRYAWERSVGWRPIDIY